MTTNVESTMRFDLYQTVTDRVIELLEKGKVPWRKPWSDLGPPMNAISKRPYQGINLWLLLMLPYESNLYLTWEQLKRVNGSVTRGAKAHIVVYWQMLDASDQKNEEQAIESREQKRQRFTLRYHKIFNVEDCTGIPPSILVSNAEKQLNTLLACENIANEMPNRPRIFNGKRRASYDPQMDYVNIPNLERFESPEAFYTTLWHELVHSTGHPKRLDRKTITEMAEFGSEPYSLEELIAELGTCYLAGYSGILEKEVVNSAAYIAGWLTKLKNDKRFVITASTQAQKAVDYILNRKDQKPTIKERP
ncbi:MAG: DUF1738 domain-containing protein [Flavobacterium sp.]|nr:MAG: DUF1738 domain-containing protein [Flavobacterium sp.]